MAASETTLVSGLPCIEGEIEGRADKVDEGLRHTEVGIGFQGFGEISDRGGDGRRERGDKV